ncbi:hypothetical protein HW555_004293 [Spodoptera exigua]|uniref:Uncharacterized protein n=1 Tax=Spodoptera exigua TaxID=7107 RepID=A0A835GJ96_SPOEX|nr:hypothetical protein HW555_004293 [Spodoptera exigua]
MNRHQAGDRCGAKSSSLKKEAPAGTLAPAAAGAAPEAWFSSRWARVALTSYSTYHVASILDLNLDNTIQFTNLENHENDTHDEKVNIFAAVILDFNLDSTIEFTTLENHETDPMMKKLIFFAAAILDLNLTSTIEFATLENHETHDGKKEYHTVNKEKENMLALKLLSSLERIMFRAKTFFLSVTKIFRKVRARSGRRLVKQQQSPCHGTVQRGIYSDEAKASCWMWMRELHV